MNFEQLVFDDVGSDKADRAEAAQAEAEASLAALQGQSMMGIHLASWPLALQAALTKVAPFYDGEKTRLVKLLKPIVDEEVSGLADEGCKPDGNWCMALQNDFGTLLKQRVSMRATLIDFWGNVYENANNGGVQIQFTTSGPDEIKGTMDDATVGLDFSAFGIQWSQGFASSADAGAAPDFGNCSTAVALRLRESTPAAR